MTGILEGRQLMPHNWLQRIGGCVNTSMAKLLHSCQRRTDCERTIAVAELAVAAALRALPTVAVDAVARVFAGAPAIAAAKRSTGTQATKLTDFQPSGSDWNECSTATATQTAGRNTRLRVATGTVYPVTATRATSSALFR
eukprot:GILJ01024495.1.p2 GENE.GILJ01024495.1~~GILJ01024495.1.p2  ORF type:complete len:141 (-),score=12.50 GILJ01024495.1:77-499(-)